MSLTIEQVTEPTDDAGALVGELEAELSALFASEQRHGLPVERLFQPGVLFVIARLDGGTVGCGGIAFGDGVAELKRMYVRPHARGRGVATAILARLEGAARARGLGRLVLETGDVLDAAIRFYEKAGYTRCEPFGEFATLPTAAIDRSLFYEKTIS